MKAEEILNCTVCGKEIRVVRLGRSLVTFGHRSNPGPNHHRVEWRPAPSSADGRSESRFEGIRRQSGALEEGAPGAVVPSTRRTRTDETRRGAVSERADRTAKPSGPSSPAGRARRVGDASPAPTARSARSA